MGKGGLLMNQVESILSEVQQIGGQLWLEGDRLKGQFPRGKLSPNLKKSIQEHKSLIIQLLREPNKKAQRESRSLRATIKKQRLDYDSKKTAQFQDQNVDKMAKKYGWLILQSGEAYEKTLNRYRTTKKINQIEVSVFNEHSIYIFKEDEGWVVWRASWRNGNAEPINERCSKPTRSFERAFQKAENYIRWWKEKNN
jgi:hypothetical protein